MRNASIVLALAGLALAGCQKGVAGDDTALWIEQLEDPEASTRAMAAANLGGSGDAEAAVGPLMKALADSDDNVRGYAAQSLGRLGPEAGEAVPALMEIVEKESRTSARGHAAWALGKIGPPAAQPAVPVLMEALLDADVTEQVAGALEALGEGPAAAARLTQAIEDPQEDPAVRAEALKGLKRAGDEKQAVALMIGVIEDEAAPAQVRRAAALAVGYLGHDGVEEARAAIPALLANLDQEGVVSSGPWSLWAMGAAEPAVARLAEVLEHSDPDLRAQAASGIVHMAGGNAPPEARAAVPALIEALKVDDRARVAVIGALGEIGPGAEAAVPALTALLEDDDSFTRDRANDAIKKIAPNP